jgi:sugar phosphate isomerase/epimerase
MTWEVAAVQLCLGLVKGMELAPVEQLRHMKAAGFDGFLTIEREVGDNPEADIAMAVDFLREKIAQHSL